MLRTPLLLLAMIMPADATVRVDRTVYLMGTELRVAVEAADRATALAAGERAVRAVEEAEARLSTWRGSSELSRVNRAPTGTKVRISKRLAADLEAARWCWDVTDGAFDPTVGALIRAWGLREGGRRPSASDVRQALGATGMGAFRVDRPDAVRDREGPLLEAGGFGKGAALADALESLAGDPRVRRASLDFGGQLAVTGPGTSWRFTVADPRDRSRPALALAVDGGSVATSGAGERGRHLLDPRTGYPAPDFGTLTVWTRDPLRADCLSTGLYVLGPEKALAWAAQQPGVEVLTLESKGGQLVARATPGLAGRISTVAEDVGGELKVLSSKEGFSESP